MDDSGPLEQELKLFDGVLFLAHRYPKEKGFFSLFGIIVDIEQHSVESECDYVVLWFCEPEYKATYTLDMIKKYRYNYLLGIK
jgi:hypothetical protein